MRQEPRHGEVVSGSERVAAANFQLARRVDIHFSAKRRPGRSRGREPRRAKYQGAIKSDLVFIVFDNEAKAEEVRNKVLGLQKDYLIEIEDAVIAIRDENGHIKLNQLLHPTAYGAVSGAFWGMLIGWIFFMPFIGAAFGAAGGALGGAMTDVGINDNQMREDARKALTPGKAGLFLLIRKMTTDKVLDDLKGEGGTVISTSFDHAKEESLKAALAAHVPAPAKEG